MSIDKTVISWLIAAGGAFILFLLSLGVKDLRDRLAEIPEIGEELAAVRNAHAKELAELNGEVRRLEQRIEDLKEEVLRLRDAVRN